MNPTMTDAALEQWRARQAALETMAAQLHRIADVLERLVPKKELGHDRNK